ncbi:MAG TPA: GIY-YIG nuclease family protein [Chthoniobacterales bacterium]|nr:GIY-YIG nuclease family protein [Chthoniobacterales bacterium]
MPMSKFTYVYVLQSEADPDRFYTGCAEDLRVRITYHNCGKVRHTAKWMPWRLKIYVAFSDRLTARRFERYLKSASGRAFARKHFN